MADNVSPTSPTSSLPEADGTSNPPELRATTSIPTEIVVIEGGGAIPSSTSIQEHEEGTPEDEKPSSSSKHVSEITEPILKSVSSIGQAETAGDRSAAKVPAMNSAELGNLGFRQIVKKRRRCRIPEDIHGTILAYLPVKPLLKFRCVCNPWNSMITSRDPFHLDHHRRRLRSHDDHHHSPGLVLIVSNEEDDGRDRFFPIQHHLCIPNSIQGDGGVHNALSFGVLGRLIETDILSCRGLVCIYYAPTNFNDGIAHMFICNPSTRELRTLPPSPTPADDHDVSCIAIGYVESSQKFKVARFFGPMDEPGKCEVLTLGDNNWREVTSPPFPHSKMKAPFLHGAFHLLPDIELDIEFDVPLHIAAFDIESEEYKRTIPLPEPKAFLFLTELGGSLCLVSSTIAPLNDVEVWKLKDYNRGWWEKEYVIDLNKLENSYLAYPLATLDDGSLLLINMKQHGDVGKWRQLLHYSCKEQRILRMIYEDCSAALYEESLFSCD